MAIHGSKPDTNAYPYSDEQRGYDFLAAQLEDLPHRPEEDRFLREMNGEFEEIDIPLSPLLADESMRATESVPPVEPASSSPALVPATSPNDNLLPLHAPPSMRNPAMAFQHNLKRVLHGVPSAGLPQNMHTPTASPVPYPLGPSQLKTNPRVEKRAAHRYHPYAAPHRIRGPAVSPLLNQFMQARPSQLPTFVAQGALLSRGPTISFSQPPIVPSFSSASGPPQPTATTTKQPKTQCPIAYTLTQSDTDPIVYAASRALDTFDCKWAGCARTGISRRLLSDHLSQDHGIAINVPARCEWMDGRGKCKSQRAGKPVTNMVKHLRTGVHLGERFECPACHADFGRADGLSAHLRAM